MRVNIVTAFGRAETLALALSGQGFRTQILDFTSAFGPEWQRGFGPFPIVQKEFIASQNALLSSVHNLSHGVSFWLKEGPVELAGAFAEFYKTRKDVEHLTTGKGKSFSDYWLKNYLEQWCSPYYRESWESGSMIFPFSEKIGLATQNLESRNMSFERYRTLELSYISATGFKDIQFDGSQVTELAVESGSFLASQADYWIWCLSTEETFLLGEKVAKDLFPRGEVRPEWRWLGLSGRNTRGPWSGGFPEYTCVIEDMNLPWVYSNRFMLRWIEPDAFHVWLMVPAEFAKVSDRQKQWASEIEAILNKRLELASWKISSDNYWLCPHSPVFAQTAKDIKHIQWKNLDWIAPESLARLDLSCRLEREAKSFERLKNQKTDLIKKQGARGDYALHAP